MNKSELINAMSEKTGLKKKDTEDALNAFMDCVTEALKNGEKVQLVGFGAFEARKKNARPGRNPRKPEVEITIPACITPAFRPGKLFKDNLNK